MKEYDYARDVWNIAFGTVLNLTQDVDAAIDAASRAVAAYRATFGEKNEAE